MSLRNTISKKLAVSISLIMLLSALLTTTVYANTPFEFSILTTSDLHGCVLNIITPLTQMSTNLMVL